MSKPLNPLSLYVTAIRLMYGLSQQPWSSPVELLESGLFIVTQTPDYGVIIYTSNMPPTTVLTTGNVVKVLLESVTDMATLDPGFYQVACFIEIEETRIGKMLITKMGDPELGSDDEGFANETLSAGSLPSIGPSKDIEGPLGNSTQLAASDEIIDFSDRRFKITWQWDGKNIPNQDVFSAALIGLAAAAQYDKYGPCDSVTALSISGNTVFHIGRSSKETLYGGQIARTFFLLINQLFLVQRRFEEMWITLWYDGMIIGDGYIYKVVRLGAGNATERVASG